MQTELVTEDVKAMGDKIRSGREAKGLSRAALAKETGIPAKAIEKFEYGEQEPSATRLRTLCRTLDIPLSDMLGQEVDEGDADTPPWEDAPAPAASFAAPQPVDAADRFEAMLAYLDDARRAGFPDGARGYFATAEDALNLARHLERDELAELAAEWELYQAKDDEASALPLETSDAPETWMAKCCDFANRLIDAAVLGVDLYSIKLDALERLANELAGDGRVRTPGIFESWEDHGEIIAAMRLALWAQAVMGTGPNFRDGKRFPKR